MRKGHHNIIQGKQSTGTSPANKMTSRSNSIHTATQTSELPDDEVICLKQYKALFTSLPDSILVCDEDDRVLLFNATALRLFELSPNNRFVGRPYQELLRHYISWREQEQPSISAPLHSSSMDAESEESAPNGKTITLHAPSGRQSIINMYWSPMLDDQNGIQGKVIVFHRVAQRYQQAHEAIITLTTAITRLPKHFAHLNS